LFGCVGLVVCLCLVKGVCQNNQEKGRNAPSNKNDKAGTFSQINERMSDYVYVRVQLDALQVQAGVAEEDLEVVDIAAPRLQARKRKGRICRYMENESA
jgi:hypothetical protein